MIILIHTVSVCVCVCFVCNRKYRASLSSLKGILISKSNKQIKGDLEVVGPEIKKNCVVIIAMTQFCD